MALRGWSCPPRETASVLSSGSGPWAGVRAHFHTCTCSRDGGVVRKGSVRGAADTLTTDEVFSVLVRKLELCALATCAHWHYVAVFLAL